MQTSSGSRPNPTLQSLQRVVDGDASKAVAAHFDSAVAIVIVVAVAATDLVVGVAPAVVVVFLTDLSAPDFQA